LASQSLIDAVQGYENYILSNGIDEDVINAYVQAVEVALRQEKDVDYGLELSKRAKNLIETLVTDLTGGNFWQLERYSQENSVKYSLIDRYYDVLRAESYDVFESFIRYMEKERGYSKRFYQPRQKTLKCVVDDLQALENRAENCVFYGLSMPSRVGKSTVCIFFLAWIAFKRPNSHSAMGGHSGILAKGFYKELLNLITTPEYTFKELFDYIHPEYANKPFPTDKSSDEFTITLGSPDRFATITCRGIDGTWTGAVDVSKDGYLYVDDLVRDREHSLSPMRMENTFQEYLNKMVDRKNDGARELMVGTLWNVLDPLQRISVQYELNNQYVFRRIPALNENDESNFDYEINGFSTDYYKKMRERLDNAEWMAKYQQQPYVREGLLFPQNEMRYFDGRVIDDERSVMAVCDPAFGGADSLSMPVVLTEKATGRRKVIDWLHKKGTQAVTVPKIVDKIARHYITELHIEQNAGGKLLSDSIREEMKKRDVHFCKIIPYYASVKMSKEDKIKGYSDWVKENLEFLPQNQYLDVDVEYKRSDEYQAAMDEVHMYTSEGKNLHDDAPDSITQVAVIESKKRKATVIMEGLL
jgi:hypothetical protein